jgi:formate hydrogenlyase subunit 4
VLFVLGLGNTVSLESKVHRKFSLTAVSAPIIIAPVFNVKQQQNSLSINTILAGQIKHSYLRETIGGNIFCIKIFQRK